MINLKQWLEDYKVLHKKAGDCVKQCQGVIHLNNEAYGQGLITTDEWYSNCISVLMLNSLSSEKYNMIKQLADDPAWPEATEESIKLMLISHNLVS